MADIKARQRAKRIASYRNLVALANDTKWREFFTEVLPARIPLEFKLIDDEEVFKCAWVISPSPNYIEGGDMGPRLFVDIEWVRSSMTQEVSRVATLVGLECVIQDNIATVYGYR